MGSKPTGISGSRAAGILGVSPYQTPLDVWIAMMSDFTDGAEKLKELGIEPISFDGNASTRWGTAFETAIIGLVEKTMNCSVIDREVLKSEKSWPLLTAHLDGVMCPTDGGEVMKTKIAIHEGKTATQFSFSSRWGEPGTDKIPAEYQAQVQHQMLVSGIETAFVSVLIFPDRPEKWEQEGLDPSKVDAKKWSEVLFEMGNLKTYKIEADKVLHFKMVKRYAEFVENYFSPMVPPPPSNYDDFKKLFRNPRGTVIATEEIERAAATYTQINKELSQCVDHQAQLKMLILNGVLCKDGLPVDGDSENGFVFRDRKGKKIASYSKTKNGSFVFRCD